MAKVGSDGSEKLPPRILGTVRDGLAAGTGTTRLSLVVAAFAACSLGPGADQWGLSDPTLARLLGGRRDDRADPGAVIDRLLGLREIFGVDLAAQPRFRAEVLGHAVGLWRDEVAAVLDGLRSRPSGSSVA